MSEKMNCDWCGKETSILAIDADTNDKVCGDCVYACDKLRYMGPQRLPLTFTFTCCGAVSYRVIWAEAPVTGEYIIKHRITGECKDCSRFYVAGLEIKVKGSRLCGIMRVLRVASSIDRLNFQHLEAHGNMLVNKDGNLTRRI